jgi:hypothetical protein
MKTRFSAYGTLLGLTLAGLPFLFGAGMWELIVVEIFHWCNDINQKSCIGWAEIKTYISIIGLLIFGIIIFELSVRHYLMSKSKVGVDLSKDISVTGIKVTNKRYENLKNCFVKINKFNIVGKNNVAYSHISGKSKYIFKWRSKLKTVEISKDVPEILDVFEATKENFFLLFQDEKHTCPAFQDIRYGENAKRARYQMEIEFFGTPTDLGNDPITQISYWEILYESHETEYFNATPRFEIQKTEKDKMIEPSANEMRDKLANGKVSFETTISNFNEKSKE